MRAHSAGTKGRAEDVEDGVDAVGVDVERDVAVGGDGGGVGDDAEDDVVEAVSLRLAGVELGRPDALAVGARRAASEREDRALWTVRRAVSPPRIESGMMKSS